MKSKILFLTLFSIIIGSCTVQKRLYMKGFHIEMNKPNLSHKSKKNLDTSEKRNLSYSNLIKNNQLNQQFSVMGSTPVCDTIYLKNGEVITALIIGEDGRETKYKLCDLDEITIIKTRKIERVCFANGTIKNYSFESKLESVFDPKLEKLNNKIINKTEVLDTIGSNGILKFTGLEKKLGAVKKTKENESNEDNKHVSIAFYLLIFGGLLGFHRFYLGYYLIGTLYVLTLGFLGIGCIIDLVLLLTGNLKPKKGIYITKN